MLSTLVNTSPESLADLFVQMRVRKTKSVVLLFSMGSQYDHLIALALARLGVYCQLCDPASITAIDVMKINPVGIIISGGPASVSTEPPPFGNAILDLGIPVLGICLGAQMIADHIGLKVHPAEKREFNVTRFSLEHSDALFADRSQSFRVQQSHGDHILAPDNDAPEDLRILGTTENSPVAAFRFRHLHGVQFHPEVRHTEGGDAIFANFCFKICGIKDPYPTQDIRAEKIAELRRTLGDKKKAVIMLSGGSDSSVAADLLGEAVNWEPGRLFGLYVSGVDRPDDEKDMWRFFGNQPWIDVKTTDKTAAFLSALEGVKHPRQKRKLFKPVYVVAGNERIREVGADYVVQGTLYTDIVESGLGHQTSARRATIKEHHNTGIEFCVPLIEPLNDCVKDNARDLGRLGSTPEELLTRHPFPGPGMVVRIEGPITAERLRVVRASDTIYMEEIRNAGLYDEIWQAGAILLESEHTTTKGDDSGMGGNIMCFAVSSVDGYTANPYPMSWDTMVRIGDRLANEIPEVGAACMRITAKPPSTIEIF